MDIISIYMIVLLNKAFIINCVFMLKIILGITRYKSVQLGTTQFFWVLKQAKTEFYCVVLSYTKLYRVVPSYTQNDFGA